MDRVASRRVEDLDWYKTALDFVRRRHAGKTDALGHPYPDHFERVALRLLRLYPDATRGQVEAALLHDALEPGETDLPALRRLGVTDDAIHILERITLPQDGRSYLDYIADLARSGDREAIEVKLADNLDATELYSSRPTPAARARMVDTYDPSRRLLQDALIAAASAAPHGSSRDG